MSTELALQRRTRTRLRVLIILLVVTGAVWIVCGIGLGRAAGHAVRLGRQVAALRGGGFSDPAALGDALPTVYAEFAGLRADLTPALAVAERMGGLPLVGPLCQVASPAAEAGEGLLGLADAIWQAGGANLLAALRSDAPLAEALPDVLAGLTDRQDVLQATALRTAAALERVEAVDPAGLPDALRRPWERVRPVLPLARAGLAALPRLAPVLAASGEQAFLALAQNNDELRPTGGFISAIGTLRVTDGVPGGLDFEDSYSIDDWTKPHGDPPEALRKHMGLDLLVTRDANWWPDFPTSARAVSQLYALERDVPVNGVVAADVYAAAALLEVLAPLELSGGLRLEKGAVLQGLRDGWGLPEEALITSGEVITASQPYDAVEVAVQFSDKPGEAWFDGVWLERQDRPGTNLVANGSFENDANGDSLPDGWTTAGLESGDGLVADVAYDGNRSLYVRGASGRAKAAVQRIPLSGAAGDVFTLGALSRAAGLELGGGPYAVAVRFVQGEQAQESGAAFPDFTHGWASAGTADLVGEWWTARKDVIGLAIGAAVERLIGAPSGVDWLALGSAARTLLDERHIQLYASDPALQDAVLASGWGGALPKAPGDLLLVVDTNVGYNKVAANVVETVQYTVTLEGARPRAVLRLTWENRSTARQAICDKYTQYTLAYADLTQGCFWDYVRAYVPAGTERIGSSGGDEPAESLIELDGTALATSVLVPPGESREVVIEYWLPPEVLDGGTYTLRAVKQAGTVAVPLEVTVLGAGLEAVEGAALTPAESAEGRLVYRTDLLVDRTIAVNLPER